MTADERPNFSVVITTRNRVSDLRVAVGSALAQVDTRVEVLVYDDASDDGTVELIRETFPEVRLFSHSERRGYIVHRNAGYRDALGDYVVSIDDDAYFTDTRTLARVAELFAQHPQAGAIALPFIEPFRERGSGHMADLPVGTPLRSYIGCAHAVRRERFLTLGGYREFLVHQGEERDFCIRMLEAGQQVLYADTPVIVHCVSPSRSRQRMTYYGYRNTLLFSAMNAPHPDMLVRMVINSVQLLLYRFHPAELPLRLRSLAAGFIDALRHRSDRRPVSRQTYRTYRERPGHGPLAWDPTVPVPPSVGESDRLVQPTVSRTDQRDSRGTR